MKSEVEKQKGDTRSQVYELGYLLVSSIAQENLPQKVSALRDVIKSAGGHLLDEGDPQYQDLAYEMTTIVSNKKVLHKTGYFGWIKFESEPSSPEAIHTKLGKDTELIRFILIKTVQENTVKLIDEILAAEEAEKAKSARLAKEEVAAREMKRKETKLKTPATKEEIDETIEKLIVE